MSDSHQILAPLVPGGSRLPFFVAPAYDTTPFSLVSMCRSIKHDIPVFAFSDPALQDPAYPSHLVEERAEVYLEEVIAAQPRGPYRLGGYCGGGTLALEMARQLLLRGKEVEAVILIESPPPPPGEDFLQTIPDSQDLRDRISTAWSSTMADIGERAATKLNMVPQQWASQYDLSKDRPRNRFREYRAQRVDCPMFLFCTEQLPAIVYHDWTNISGSPVETTLVPGDVDTMLRPPHVRTLAAAIAETLTR